MQDPQPSSPRTGQQATPANGTPPDDRGRPQASPPAGQAPPAAGPPNRARPRWGEPGYRAPADPARQSRVAVAWTFGIIGALGLVAVALVGFAILFAAGHRAPAPVSGAPLPTMPGAGQAPALTSGPAPGQGAGPGGSGPATSGPGAPGRVGTTEYSFKLPDGFQDVTADYRAAHPSEGAVVQSLAQADPAARAPAEIRISQLPRGFGSGQSLEEIARSRAGALVQTASGLGALRHSTLGPDPSVEVAVPLRSGGHRTEVIVRHAGRVWEISVIDPGKGAAEAEQAWQQTIKPGWQWPA